MILEQKLRPQEGPEFSYWYFTNSRSAKTLVIVWDKEHDKGNLDVLESLKVAGEEKTFNVLGNGWVVLGFHPMRIF